MSCKIKTSIIVKTLSDTFHQWLTRVLMTTLKNFVHRDRGKSLSDKIVYCVKEKKEKKKKKTSNRKNHNNKKWKKINKENQQLKCILIGRYYRLKFQLHFTFCFILKTGKLLGIVVKQIKRLISV